MRPPCRVMMRRTVARPMPVPSKSAAECSRWNTPNSLSAYFMSKPAPLSRTMKARPPFASTEANWTDRKSTRLNSSHGYISYAVFCLKKKKPEPWAAAAPGGRHPAGGRGRARPVRQGQGRDDRPAERRDPVRRGGRHRQGTAADRGVGGGGDGRGEGQRRHPAAGVRDQHAGVHDARGRPAHRRDHRSRAADPDGEQARPRRGQGLPPPGGPGHAALVHPGVQAAHDRRGRRRRRPARSRVPAPHHRRRHGLGVGHRLEWRSRLYRPRVSGWALMVLVLAAGATILVAMAVSPAGQVLLTYLSAQWDAAKYWLTGLF